VRKRKKLLLSKETVRNLGEQVGGGAVAGGADSFRYQCLTWACVTSAARFECADACIEPEG